MAAQQPQTGIEITARFFILQFLLFLFPPTFVVDGQPTKAQWRKPFYFTTTPGQHTVRIFFAYLLFREAGAAETQIDVASNTVRRVTYRAPLLVFMRGNLSVQ
jgi:hypothetical protein